MIYALEEIRQVAGDPVERYWSFIWRRVALCGVEWEETVEGRVLARLSCMMRATKEEEMDRLKEVWYSMMQSERCYLCSRLGSDGIEQQAVMLLYMPLFFTNVKANVCLTLEDAFHVLIGFFGRLEEFVNRSDFQIRGTTDVNILEMAKVAAKVRTPRMLQQSVEALEIQSGEEGKRKIFRVVYPPGFWRKVFSREELAPERVALHRLESGVRQSIRNNSAAYEATMQASKIGRAFTKKG